MKRNIATWLLILSCCLPAQAEPESQKWAVVIGIDSYQNAGLVPLDCAVADAKVLA